MNARVQVVIAVAFALIAVFAVGGPITWWWWSRARIPAATHNVLPILDKGQLRALLTYQRECRTQADCETPLTCVIDPSSLRRRCLASTCEADHQCRPGFMCASVHLYDARSIRLCLIQGTQKEGERCEGFHTKENQGCQPGLICRAGYCTRSCDPGGFSACPDGFVCQDWGREPTCLPSCLHNGCPPEKQCVRLEGEFSVCATVRGQDCDKQPCPRGEECQRELGDRWQPQVVKMWCAVPCKPEEGKLCPAGLVCINEACARPCDKGVPGSCAPGERCTMFLLGPNESQDVTVCEVSE